MRWRLVAVVLAVCVAVVRTPSQAAPSEGPSLRLVTLAPLTLRGSGFLSHERVRVALTVTSLRAVRMFRADTLGGFTYRPQTLIALDPCRGTIVVAAVGLASERRATWKRACRPPDIWP